MYVIIYRFNSQVCEFPFFSCFLLALVYITIERMDSLNKSIKLHFCILIIIKIFPPLPFEDDLSTIVSVFKEKFQILFEFLDVI